jgi:putative resolvase
MPESLLQKDDLERWKQLIHRYAKDKGYGEVQILSDVGSGLNEKGKHLLRLLGMVIERKASKVIVAYENELTRFGFETLRKMFQVFGAVIEVINSREENPQEEVIEGVRKLVSG